MRPIQSERLNTGRSTGLPGGYDAVAIFEAPDEKVAMHLALKLLDRMEIMTLVTLPDDEMSPAGPT